MCPFQPCINDLIESEPEDEEEEPTHHPITRTEAEQAILDLHNMFNYMTASTTTVNYAARVEDSAEETLQIPSIRLVLSLDNSTSRDLTTTLDELLVECFEDPTVEGMRVPPSPTLRVEDATSSDVESLLDCESFDDEETKQSASLEISCDRHQDIMIVSVPSEDMGMCDHCKEMVELMYSYANRVGILNKGRSHDSADIEDLDEVFSHNSKVLSKDEVSRFEILLCKFSEKPCLCRYNDETYDDRLRSFTESLILSFIKQLSVFDHQNTHLKNNELPPLRLMVNRWIPDDYDEKSEEQWTFEQVATLFQIMLKVFFSYPLYLRPQLLNKRRSRTFSQFCDPIIGQFESKYIRQNVDLFCRLRGVQMISDWFDYKDLPINFAFSLMPIAWSLQEWLNTKSLITLFLPLRSKILRYLCNMKDESYSTTLFMSQTEAAWKIANDFTRIPIVFDKDGLDLAFRCLTSSTLETQLAGLAQINFHIKTFEDVSNLELAAWLVDNKIIAQIFNPDVLVVEIIEQSHIILTFLATENKITNNDIDIIWSAAQLELCFLEVFDLLYPLTENLSSAPRTHLSRLINHTMKTDLETGSFTCSSERPNYTTFVDKTHAVVMQERSHLKRKLDGKSTSTNLNSGSDPNMANEDALPCKRTNLIAPVQGCCDPPDSMMKPPSNSVVVESTSTNANCSSIFMEENS